jgi:hypothetical protein
MQTNDLNIVRKKNFKQFQKHENNKIIKIKGKFIK